MTFEELATRVAVDADLSTSHAKEILHATFDAIRSHVIAGGRVSIPKFGTFTRAERKGGKRTIGTSTYVVPSRQVVKFKAAQGAKRVVR